jgi:DNA polymerase-3 subunit alpha
LGQKYIAITDHGSIDGILKFQKEAIKQEIIPILGCEAYIVKDDKVKQKGDDRGHVTLLIKNEKGFQNLCKMLTYANLEGFYYRPRIDYDLLCDNLEGLIVLTGCAESFIAKDGGGELLYDLNQMTKDLYMEVMPHDLEKQREINKLCLYYADQWDIPLVGTNDCHYVNKDDAKTQEVLLAMQTKAKWNDKNRFRFPIDGLHLRSDEEMINAFADQNILDINEIQESLETTIEIAEKCKDFSIKKQSIYLPNVPGLEKEDPDKFIYDYALKRLKELGLENDVNYLNRLEEESQTIAKKKFAPYFMIIKDLARWCRKNDIMVGPGRGSAAGSLMAYLLGITTIDPMRFGLLFSRFIADDRNDIPDVDMDFPDYKRNLIREHLEELYGKNNIASISTFQTMKGRAVIRDVARVFDIPIQEVDRFSKSIIYEEENGENIIEKAIKETPEGREFNNKYPEIVKHAIKLEGLNKSAGQHAAGIIISADDLTQGTKGNLVSRSNLIVSNWDMEDSEYMGLMKLDVLGLNTLSVLNEAKNLIKQNKNQEIIFEKIPIDDPEIYKDIANGYTIGLFQLSAWATTKLAREIKADNFMHLSDVIALVRPGPFYSGQTDIYIKRKNGGAWIPKHPLYEKITEKTFGVIIYQEQVMEVINKVAGLSYSTADKIRKIISKKRDAREFKPFKDSFINGCLQQKTLSRKEAEEFWEGLKEHSQYSFNLSHSVSYAMLGYWTAYIKHYFPTEFICASLTHGSSDKKEEMIDEAYRLGLQVVLPQVGISDAYKWIAKENKLYCPFIEIKGIGEKTALNCVNFKKTEIQETKKKNATELILPFFTTGDEKKKRVEKAKEKSKLEQMLELIGAFGNEPEEGISKYFSFKIKNGKKDMNPNLIKKIGFTPSEEDMPKWLSLDISERYALSLIKEKTFKEGMFYEYLPDCKDCPLGRETEFGPVLPSSGKYNIIIAGEAPGRDEDEQGNGFVGRAGKAILWPELKKYDLNREDFHITNCCKCYPSISKTPNKEQIKICKKWLKKEIENIKPCLVLAFGNTSIKAFTGRDGGITELSGKTEWNEEFNCWICWALHPAAVLHNPNNKVAFENGIKNFSEKIFLLGDLK